MALLEVSDLDAGYGDLQIPEGVDLDVADGEYVTIVGPNGAGKSTVMKSIFGLTEYMGGLIVFDDSEIHGYRPEDIIQTGVGYVPRTTTSSRRCRSSRTSRWAPTSWTRFPRIALRPSSIGSRSWRNDAIRRLER